MKREKRPGVRDRRAPEKAAVLESRPLLPLALRSAPYHPRLPRPNLDGPHPLRRLHPRKQNAGNPDPSRPDTKPLTSPVFGAHRSPNRNVVSYMAAHIYVCTMQFRRRACHRTARQVGDWVLDSNRRKMPARPTSWGERTAKLIWLNLSSSARIFKGK